MRELTFRGFLTQYVRQLSGKDTTSFFKLVEEANNDNPRLREPLLLFALYSNKQNVLLRASKSTHLYFPYAELLQTYDAESMTECLVARSELLPEEYHKVWRSYQSVKNRSQTDDYTKGLMRKKIIRLQKQTGVTTYRIYTDLNINKGNLNAWIKHGDSSKVSLETARKTLHYIENICSTSHLS